MAECLLLEERRPVRKQFTGCEVVPPMSCYSVISPLKHSLRTLTPLATIRVVHAQVQNEFMQDRIEVVVATIAFGMGVDKGTVRRVIHYGLSSSMDNYAQERLNYTKLRFMSCV